MRRAMLLALPAALLLASAVPAQKPPSGGAPAPGPAPAPAPAAGPQLEVVRFGLYQLQAGGTRRGPDGISHAEVREVRLLESTTRVPARIGVHFGAEYLLRGKPGRSVVLETATVFPPPGLRPPGQPAVRASSSEVTVELGNPEPIYRGWSFDEQWELVPGTWTMEFRLDGRLIGQVQFEVVAEGK